MSQTPVKPKQNKVVVATTVMLSFISFWRAAAIVLSDLASSAFYAGGIAEQAVGRAAPWFILGVMLFSYAVRSLYVESCTMFTRGGVYRVVKEAMGGTMAKISVSALMFDFLLTGPISGVSAGQYIIGLVSQVLRFVFHIQWEPGKETINLLSAGIAILITVYFWRRNIKGLHESSDDALRILKITTVMVVLMILWAGLTLMEKGPAQMPPLPKTENLRFDRAAIGWLPDLLPGAFTVEKAPGSAGPDAGKASQTGAKDKKLQADSKATAPSSEERPSGDSDRYRAVPPIGAFIGLLGILVAFGHSVLAMSGEETLAQVNRELAYPKHKNLMRAGMVIFVYSVLFTSLVSFFAAMLIPNEIRPHFYDNLIAGITMYLVGPVYLKLLFQCFVVLVGFLLLAGAVNTSIIGSNGVLNRVSEDGVLTDWFRHPHPKFGTTHRIIDLIAVLQIVTILLSRGEVYLLGEAYAFGVVWSFALNGLSVLLLRFKYKTPREWKVPFNFHIGKVEIPLGLSVVSAALFFIAVINIFTKEVATITGVTFSIIFFVIFTVSERINYKKHLAKGHDGVLEQFNLAQRDQVSCEDVAVRPGNILVCLRNYNKLHVLERIIETADWDHQDIVVATLRVFKGFGGDKNLREESVFTDYEQKLFSRVVSMAEKFGKTVHLLVVPAVDIYEAMARTAYQLDSHEIVVGISSLHEAREQARRIGLAWDKLIGKTTRSVRFTVFSPEIGERSFALGAHAPRLTEDDINFIHDVWLHVVSTDRNLRYVHHRDVVRVAVERLRHDMDVDPTVLGDFRRTVAHTAQVEPPGDALPGGEPAPSPTS